MNKPLISVVSPVYNAEKIVDKLVSRIIEETSKITDNFEIILIEDGSPDNSWDKIQQNCKMDNRIKGISLSRNFGQHFAITAGFSHAKGRFVVLMDCDLQDNPLYISDLYNKILEGYDIVYAKKKRRNHGFFKDFTSKVFYKSLSLISDFKMDPDIGSFSIVSDKVVDAFLKFNDYRRGYGMVLKWLGFKEAYIQVEHNKRFSGHSSYTSLKLIKLALTITLAYSDKPLRLSIYSGISFSILAFLGIIYLIFRYLSYNTLEGWTSLMVLISLVGGFIMIFLGIIGIYIGKMFEQVKNRPLFLIKEARNF